MIAMKSAENGRLTSTSRLPRITLVSALIGPSFVVVVQTQALFALFLVLTHEADEVALLPALIASTVLAIALPLQISQAMLRGEERTWSRILVLRQSTEDLISHLARLDKMRVKDKPVVSKHHNRPGVDSGPDLIGHEMSSRPPWTWPLTLTTTPSRLQLREDRSLYSESRWRLQNAQEKAHQEAVMSDARTLGYERSSAPHAASKFGRVAEIDALTKRFGLEPTWAYRRLLDLAVPAANELFDHLVLLSARWAGRLAAAILALTIVAASPGLLQLLRIGLYTNGSGAAYWTCYALICIILIGTVLSLHGSVAAIRDYDALYYDNLSSLTELHRFDLYRALSIPTPRNSRHEQRYSLSAWRLEGGPQEYRPILFNGNVTRPDSQAGVPATPADVVAALRGMPLVAFDGWISWATTDRELSIAIGSVPALRGGQARLQVNGDDAPSATFDLTVDSTDLQISQPRVTIEVPSDGTVARASIALGPPQADGQVSDQGSLEVWLEISQQGRFIQLLRVPIRPVTVDG